MVVEVRGWVIGCVRRRQSAFSIWSRGVLVWREEYPKFECRKERNYHLWLIFLGIRALVRLSSRSFIILFSFPLLTSLSLLWLSVSYNATYCTSTFYSPIKRVWLWQNRINLICPFNSAGFDLMCYPVPLLQ